MHRLTRIFFPETAKNFSNINFLCAILEAIRFSIGDWPTDTIPAKIWEKNVGKCVNFFAASTWWNWLKKIRPNSKIVVLGPEFENLKAFSQIFACTPARFRTFFVTFSIIFSNFFLEGMLKEVLWGFILFQKDLSQNENSSSYDQTFPKIYIL